MRIRCQGPRGWQGSWGRYWCHDAGRDGDDGHRGYRGSILPGLARVLYPLCPLEPAVTPGPIGGHRTVLTSLGLRGHGGHCRGHGLWPLEADLRVALLTSRAGHDHPAPASPASASAPPIWGQSRPQRGLDLELRFNIVHQLLLIIFPV